MNSLLEMICIIILPDYQTHHMYLLVNDLQFIEQLNIKASHFGMSCQLRLITIVKLIYIN